MYVQNYTNRLKFYISIGCNENRSKKRRLRWSPGGLIRTYCIVLKFTGYKQATPMESIILLILAL